MSIILLKEDKNFMKEYKVFSMNISVAVNFWSQLIL